MHAKVIFAAAAGFTVLAGAAEAHDTYTQGYYRQNGTYVAPHYSTAPDNNVFNNYSTQGNINPYTGQPGTVNPYTTAPPTIKLYNPYATTP